MADRYGRRLPLLVGVSIFTLASAACALAPSLEWLIAARFVQALGGCAGMVIRGQWCVTCAIRSAPPRRFPS